MGEVHTLAKESLLGASCGALCSRSSWLIATFNPMAGMSGALPLSSLEAGLSSLSAMPVRPREYWDGMQMPEHACLPPLALP